VTIREYTPADNDDLFLLMWEEGPDWQSYWAEPGRSQYEAALRGSLAFVAYDGTELCGYVRCRDDDGFGVHILDLLVKPSRRGNALGRALMKAVANHYPGHVVYVHSDVDPYYEKQGFTRAGSIFEVKL